MRVRAVEFAAGAAVTTRAKIEASRARIAAAADPARRRLERDLHDGAQQQLVTTALSVEIEHSRRRRRGAGARGLKGPTRRAAGSASDSA
jgi:signal transduction histidine kinase